MDKEAGNKQLHFTSEIWEKDTKLPPSVKKEKVQTVSNNKYPFIDMKLSWYPEGT